MPPLALTVIATIGAQAIGALLLALLLRHFHRRYREPYLHHWSASWAAYAVYLSAAAAALALTPWMGAGTAPRLALAMIGSFAAYLQLLWLVQGARALAAGGAVWPRLLPRALPVLAAVALATTLAFAWDPAGSGARYFLRVGVRAGVATVAFLAAAWLVLRARPGGIRSGPRLVAGAFVVFALHQAHYFVVAAVGSAGRALAYAPYLGFVDLLVQWVMGLGMVVCLLEDERAAAAQAAARAEHLALHDVLTGLPNRALFADRLATALRRAVREDERVAVLFLDLDRFKLVNDSLGHTAGDALLREIARRLAATVRSGDTVARVGGDEFTLLFPGLRRGEDAGRIARKLLDAVREPVEVGGRELLVTASVGAAVYPDDGPDAETLVQRADAAMYGAKDAGRDRLQFSSAAMVARAADQLVLESDLRRAVAAGDLVVHYQPVLDARTGESCAVEALVRWPHPGRGLLPPGAFIPLAEQMGLTHRIGVQVLREACAQTARWQRAGFPGLGVAVNLAADHFKDPHLVEEVVDALAAAGLPAHALELEITESVAMENADASIGTLHRLKGLGVRIAIDDFGTGYSSLSYLKRFPVDTLKVDRSLVADVHRDRGDAAIVATVVTLAQSLGMQVVAEGVETEAQLALVRELGCDLVQGYLFGRPVAAGEVAALLRTAGAAA